MLHAQYFPRAKRSRVKALGTFSFAKWSWVGHGIGISRGRPKSGMPFPNIYIASTMWRTRLGVMPSAKMFV